MTESPAAPPPSAQPPLPARSDPLIDYISFPEYFADLFVPELKINLPLKQAHRDICEILEASYIGEIEQPFIWITMPPRIGKSMILRALATYGEGYFPTSQIILTGYNDDIAKESLGWVSRTMKEQWYKDFFGDLVHGDKDDHLSTVQGGNVYAEGVGGALLGKGAGLKDPAGGFIGVDDPAKADQVLSLTVSKKLNMWVENPLLHRRNSDRWCPIIGISQRLGLSDMPEYFKRTYPKETLIIKCAGFSRTVNGWRSNFPETISDDRYEQLQRTRVGRFVLASVYQQEPIALGGNMIPTDKFARHQDYELLWEEKILSADLALKKGQENDYWVCQCWGRLGGKCYLLDQMKMQCNTAEFIKAVVPFYKKHNDAQQYYPVGRFLIEDTVAGPGVISVLNEAGIPATPVQVVKDKAARVSDILAYIETGMILIPADNDIHSAHWLPDFLAECSAFSQDLTHEHDDAVDAMTQAVSNLLGEGISILQVLGVK